MSNIAIIYKSKYGSTKKYAEWIAQETKADLFDSSKIDIQKLMDYDTIVYGGGIYANGIAGISAITKNYEKLKDKRIMVFTVGIASTDDKKAFLPIIEKNFSKEMRENIEFFHFRGEIDYKNLGIIHKSMLTMLKAKSSKDGEKKISDEDIEILVVNKGKLDFKDKNSIEPLLLALEDQGRNVK